MQVLALWASLNLKPSWFLCFRNLDETTKSVYKENVRLSEALNYHMKEGELLKKERERLKEESERLMGEKEVNDMMVQEKVIQAKQQKELIKEVGQGHVKYQGQRQAHKVLGEDYIAKRSFYASGQGCVRIT